MTFEEFIQATWPRVSFVEEPGIAIYVRRATPYRAQLYGIDFDLANMTAYKPGCGALTNFLDKYEPLYGFYIEIIHNERLVPYFERRGYSRVPTSYPTAPDYYKWRPIK